MARKTHTVLSVTFCPITSQTHRVDPVRFQRHIAGRWCQCFVGLNLIACLVGERVLFLMICCLFLVRSDGKTSFEKVFSKPQRSILSFCVERHGMQVS